MGGFPELTLILIAPSSLGVISTPRTNPPASLTGVTDMMGTTVMPTLFHVSARLGVPFIGGEHLVKLPSCGVKSLEVFGIHDFLAILSHTSIRLHGISATSVRDPSSSSLISLL